MKGRDSRCGPLRPVHSFTFSSESRVKSLAPAGLYVLWLVRDRQSAGLLDRPDPGHATATCAYGLIEAVQATDRQGLDFPIGGTPSGVETMATGRRQPGFRQRIC